jgi:endonuclease YncB( thermonuclease family)
MTDGPDTGLPKPIPRRRFVVGFTLFLLLLGGSFWGLMRVAAPRLSAGLAERAPFYELTEVLSGDTLLVRANLGGKRDKEDQAPLPVKIVGLRAPPLVPGPDAAAFARDAGCPEEEVPVLGRVARNAIKGWIYRQSNLLLDFDPDAPVFDAQGRLLARAEIGHVDIGRIQLREGQGLTSGEDHPLRVIYERAEQEAREARAGVWRWAPPD